MAIYIFLIILIILIYNWCNNIEIKIYDSGKSGIKLLIIAGTHGNEPAGSIYLKNYFNFKPKNGVIYVIHSPNKLGLLLNNRYLLHKIFNRDLNRNFPKNNEDKSLDIISKKIVQIVNKCDFILDFHEAWGYYRQKLGSLGSGIYPAHTPNSIKLSDQILTNLNNSITIDYKKFTTIHNYNEIGTLKYYCEILGKDYILIETTGQNNVQKLEIRLNQIHTIIMTTLEYLNIKN
jgi:predicted deacylase